VSSGPPSPPTLGGADPAGPGPGDLLDSAEAGRATIRGGTLRVLGYGAGAALTLASVPLLVRHLGVVGFGRYTTVVSLVAIVGAITDAGLAAVAIREHATTSGRLRERLVRNLLGIRIVLTTLGVAAAAAFAALAGYDASLVLGTVLAGAGLVLLVVQQTWATALQADLRLGWVTVAELLRQAVFVAGIIALVVLGSSIVGLFAVAIPSSLATLALTAVLVRGTTALRPSFDVAVWRTLLRDTLPVAAAVALHGVYLRVVIVLMSVTAAGLQTGYFATSFRIVEVLLAVPFLLSQAILPVLARAARDDEERLAYALQRALEVALVGGAGATVLTVVGAPLAVNILAGAEGEGAVDVLRVQAIVVALTCLTTTWQYTLFALRCHHALVIANLAGLVAVVTGALVLVPSHGAVGAAVAAVLGELVLLAASVGALVRLRPRLRPALRNLLPVAGASATGLAAGLLPDVADVLRIALAAAAYAAVAFMLRAVPAELTQALRPR
jgi:O-antigen/teichoic acid export membrane protein